MESLPNAPLKEEEWATSLNALLQAYDLNEEETGTSSLLGSKCLGFQDMPPTLSCMGDLLFGEVLFHGVLKLMDKEHCDASSASSLIDLGMGIGKFCLQVFMMFPSLRNVLGVEMAPSRAGLAFEAAERWAKTLTVEPCLISKSMKRFLLEIPRGFTVPPAPVKKQIRLGKRIRKDKPIDAGAPKRLKKDSNAAPIVAEERKENDTKTRTLEYRCGDLFDVTAKEMHDADIVMCQTAFLRPTYPRLCAFLDQMKTGARLVTYHDLELIYREQEIEFRFLKLEINISMDDRFFTTWAPVKGHHFHIWRKI